MHRGSSGGGEHVDQAGHTVADPVDDLVHAQGDLADDPGEPTADAGKDGTGPLPAPPGGHHPGVGQGDDRRGGEEHHRDGDDLHDAAGDPEDRGGDVLGAVPEGPQQAADPATSGRDGVGGTDAVGQSCHRRHGWLLPAHSSALRNGRARLPAFHTPTGGPWVVTSCARSMCPEQPGDSPKSVRTALPGTTRRGGQQLCERALPAVPPGHPPEAPQPTLAALRPAPAGDGGCTRRGRAFWGYSWSASQVLPSGATVTVCEAVISWPPPVAVTRHLNWWSTAVATQVTSVMVPAPFLVSAAW